MRTVLLLVVHFLTTLVKLVGPGGARAIVADTYCAAISDRGFALKLVAKRLHFSEKKKGLAFN
ncbi:hypothetical protein [Nitrosomonas sp.]|uniref:hypothetical protein n=1 Tax=Nitrosomonas sp. TaxID=42353 RepID=UPI00374CD8D6